MGKRHLRIIHTVSSLNAGGMEHFVLRIAQSQQSHGHSASVLAVRGGPLLEYARQLRVPVVVPGGSKATRLLRASLAMGRIQPDIVHSHNPTSLQYGVLGKVLTGARLVITDHAQGRGIFRVPRDFEWRLADAVIGCSRDTAQKSGGVGKAARVVVIHNGVGALEPRRSRDEVRRELGLGGDEVVGVIVATLGRIKGHDVLLPALAKLKEKGSRCVMLLVGDGPDRAAIEAQARDLRLGPESVRFLGLRADIADLLSASDFFVLPSRTEGLPLSVLEAMACRLPVVATPVGGIPELCTDGEHGFLTPVEDVDALAAAMDRLILDGALRRSLGEAGFRRVRDEFSFDQMTRRYEDLYRELLG